MSIWKWLFSWRSKPPQHEPPELPIFWTLQSVYLARAYYVVAELKIGDLLREGPRTTGQLAEATGSHERSLYRILRALSGFGVFRENDEGQFEMTPAAEPLLSDKPGSVRDWTVLTGTLPTWQAFGQALEVVKTGKNGFELAHGQLGSLWEYCDHDPQFGETFIKAQSSWTQWQRDAILREYDFRRFRKVIDIGGGRGSFLAGVLAQSPETRGVLFDQPQAIELARPLISEAGLDNRCELVAGSFFDTIPTGGDAYVVKHVLRDWDDESVRKILANCHQVMAPEATLLLIDATIDPQNSHDRITKLLDLEQMFWLNGALRTLDEWESLLRNTGFRLVDTRRTAIVDAVILEAAKAD